MPNNINNNILQKQEQQPTGPDPPRNHNLI